MDARGSLGGGGCAGQSGGRVRDRARSEAELRIAAQATGAGHRTEEAQANELGHREILHERGAQPGLVHIFSAMESCASYKPWHDKRTGQTFLKPDSGKCLHYYFYFIDPALGLCYLRVPTWAPFRLQFYCNGHNLLATKLAERGIGYQLMDNAFVEIADFARAQKLADELHVRMLHRALDRFARLYCPVLRPIGVGYHWSLMQVEYATDLLFTDAQALHDVYDPLTRTAIHAVKAEHVATFLGRKQLSRFPGELGTDFTTRQQGTRIKHHMGPVALKMYDKFARVLRIETTANNVSFFNHHRQVEQADGRRVVKLAPVRKTIYSLAPDLPISSSSCSPPTCATWPSSPISTTRVRGSRRCAR